MLESRFKANQREAFEVMGWKFITLDPGGGVPTGFPDTLVLAPNGYHCFVEWKKSANASHRPLQGFWINKLGQMGHDAQFVYPENVDEWRQEVLRKGAE